MPSFRSQHSYSLASARRQNPAPLIVYGAIFLFLAGLVMLVQIIRSAMPMTYGGDFHGDHSFKAYLSQFTEPHPANSRANGIMHDWLVATVQEFKTDAAASGVVMDILANDSNHRARGSDRSVNDTYWFVESRNVIVRLHGQSGKDKAILINAHYDSVPTSHGVTDNGGGVSVALETIHYFVRHPPRHTLIFLFNNMEEGGLFGIRAFVNHPWFSTVRLFINLEGAGAGGRALLFRSSSVLSVKHLASSGARFLHASPLGNDLFALNLVRSDTDYSVLTAHGLPGLDIAFYMPRSHYHTPRDTLEYASPAMLQHMGEMVLGTLKNMNKDDAIFHPAKFLENLVYYDILGRIMVAYSFSTAHLIHAMALVGIPCLFASIVLVKAPKDRKANFLKRKIDQVIQGTLVTLVAFISANITVYVVSAAMYLSNPSMTYGNIYMTGGYLALGALFGLLLGQMGCQRLGIYRQRDGLEIHLYGFTSLGWLLTVATAIAGVYEKAALYSFVYIYVSAAASTLLYHAVNTRNSWRHLVVFVTQALCPTAILLDFGFLLMDTMRHTTPDGTPEFSVYVIVSVPITLIVTQLLPWIHFAGFQRKAVAIVGVALLFMFTICSALKPFNADWSPNKFVFHQFHNLSNPLSSVKLVTATNLESTLRKALPPSEFETLRCEPLKHQTQCTYDTTLVPKYAVPGEVSVTSNRTCNGSKCSVEGSTTSQNSLMCRVDLDHPVDHTWVNGDVSEGQISAFVSYITTYGATVRWGFEYPQNVSTTARIGCYYDEWTHGELPAFTTLKKNLPSDTELMIRGNGIALVHFTTLYFED